MRDAEILLRYIAYRNFMAIYNGNLKVFLDETTLRLSRDWNSRENAIQQQAEGMDEALRFTRRVFGDRNYLRKWNGRNFESKKNRAVFDIMLHYFSRDDVRDALNGKESTLKDAFQKLCENDRFRTSLETTTKSMESNRVRFNGWGEVVERLSDIDLNDMKFAE